MSFKCNEMSFLDNQYSSYQELNISIIVKCKAVLSRHHICKMSSSTDFESVMDYFDWQAILGKGN